jgi:hypothetical protein
VVVEQGKEIEQLLLREGSELGAVWDVEQEVEDERPKLAIPPVWEMGDRGWVVRLGTGWC